MCGIVGVHTANKNGFMVNERNALQGLLVANSLRGTHSTGLAGFDKNEANKAEVNIVKSVGSPYDLMDWVRTDEFWQRMVARFGTVIGHGRYATRGEVNADNAHPFEEDHIVLVHNGGISNFFSLKDWKKHKHIEVDSHLVARLIADEGAEAVLPRLQGAYTLVWYDTRDGSLNMARNEERPMFFAENKNNMFFASEQEALEFVDKRYNLKLDTYSHLPTHEIYTFAKGSLAATSVAYKPEPVRIHQNNSRRDNDMYDDRYNDYTPQKTTHVPAVSKKKQKMQQQASVIDMHTSKIVSSANLALGDYVSAVIEDFDSVGGNHPTRVIKAYHEDYPNVEFVAYGSWSENAIIQSLTVKGTVDRILFVGSKETIRGVAYRAFLHDTVLENPTETDNNKLGFIDKDKEWIQITNTSDDSVASLATYRFKQLAHKGCGFCDRTIPPEQLETPENMGYWHGNGEESVVCVDCMVGWSSVVSCSTLN